MVSHVATHLARDSTIEKFDLHTNRVHTLSCSPFLPAYSLASAIRKFNTMLNESHGSSRTNISLEGLLNDYEKRRWARTTSISIKAALLGYLETGSPGFLSKFRDSFFFVAGLSGLARSVFLDGATPYY